MEENKDLENQKTNTAENKDVEGAGNVDTQTTEKNEGKAEIDVKAEAQKIADAMFAKKMKGMPSKEELKAFKDWQESQKTAEQKQQEEIIKMQNLQSDNNFKTQMLEIMKNGLSYDEAEFVQFKLSKMNGDFEENLETYLKNNKTEDKEEKKTTTTGFSQNNTNKVVNEDKAYLDKKYANNPYYKK